MVTTERVVASNGIELHIAEAGEGPLVVLCHGFPEIGYSWRHQIPALAAAGYHAVAPDQRGYGGSSCPEAVEAYDNMQLTDDMLGLLDVLGEEQAVFVGHDFGTFVVWTLALRAPERVRGVVSLSVPYGPPRGQMPTTAALRRAYGDDSDFYILQFQEPGLSDAGFNRDPAATMRGLMAGPWISDDEVARFTAAFEQTGFTPGLNWYRNIDRNYELMAAYHLVPVDVPALYIGGGADPMTSMLRPERMDGLVTDLRGSVILDGAGHWLQQERPDDVNALLLDFLKGL